MAAGCRMSRRGRCAGAWRAARNSSGSAPAPRRGGPDAFGKRGRAWLAALELPADERETVDGCLRQIDFLDGEIAILERAIAEYALGSEAVKRLMTVPGVSLMTAATFIAAVGDIRRFQEPGKLVGYLGLEHGATAQPPTAARRPPLPIRADRHRDPVPASPRRPARRLPQPPPREAAVSVGIGGQLAGSSATASGDDGRRCGTSPRARAPR